MPGKGHVPDLTERIIRTLKSNTNRTVGGLGRVAAPSSTRDRIVASARTTGALAPAARLSMIDAFSVTDDSTATFVLTYRPIVDSWNLELNGLRVHRDEFIITGRTVTITDPADLFLGADTQNTPWALEIQYDYLAGVPTTPADPAGDLSIISVFSHNGTGDAPLGSTAEAGDLLLTFCSGGPTAPPGWTLELSEPNTNTTTKLYSLIASGGETVAPYGEPSSFGAFQVVVRGGGTVVATAGGTGGAGDSFGLPQGSVTAGDLLLLAANAFQTVVGVTVDSLGADVLVLGGTSPGANGLQVGYMLAPATGTSPLETAHGAGADEWAGIVAVIR